MHFTISLHRFTVMAALVAAIHVLPAATKTWMRGTSPRMTNVRFRKMR
jgi:hypothetical protein